MDSNKFYNMDQIPDAATCPEFWKVMTDVNFKHSVNFLIINEIRKYPPETMSGEIALVQMAKIKVLQELIDFPNALLSCQQELAETTEETKTVDDL